MYTIETFKSPIKFKNIEDFDLHKFSLFFEEKIANRKYTYINSKGKVKSVIIEFRGENLPHLIGLQYWKNLSTNQPSKQYQLLLDGTLNIAQLKKSDSHSFKKYKIRMNLLPYFYSFFYGYDCEIKLVERTSNIDFNRRKVDMIFKRDDSPEVYLLELRLKGTNKTTYVPSSITVHNMNSLKLKAKYLPLHIQNVKIELL